MNKKEKKGDPISFRPDEIVENTLHKMAHDEDRSLSYIINRELHNNFNTNKDSD